MAPVDVSASAMWLVFFLAIVLVVAAVIRFLLKGRQGPVDFPYVKRAALFSPAERSFLGVLEQAVSPEYRVFGKVRLADVVEPRRSLDGSQWQAAFNRTSAKHLDFVLCASDDVSVVSAIELDDRTHRAPRREARDAFVAGVCQAVSLPLLQIPARRSYAVPELRAQVMSALGRQALETREAATDAAPGSRPPLASASPETPVCPKCSAPMVRRQARTGASAGEAFWGCSRYPSCRGIVPAASRP